MKTRVLEVSDGIFGDSHICRKGCKMIIRKFQNHRYLQCIETHGSNRKSKGS